MAPPKSHPLRRISTGSLTGLANSQTSSSTSPSGLDHLKPALLDFCDEAATLSTNIQGLNKLYDSLGTFNEAFAGYLYALRMNAFCVEWPEAPDDRSFSRVAELAPLPEPIPSRIPIPVSPTPSTSHLPQDPDNTYATIQSTAEEAHYPQQSSTRGRGGGTRGTGVVAGRGRGGTVAGRGGRGGKAGAGGAQSAVERKKRDAAIGAIIDTLPIEYRGKDMATRNVMEKVLTQLMLNPEGRRIADITSPPDLPQAKVNKCLIALVGKKAVGKTMIGGVAVYKLQ